MNEKLAIEKEIIHQGILPLFYHNDAATCIFITKALYAAGIRSIEFTNRGTQALQNFSLLIHEKNSTMPDLLVGIGTIKNEEEANTFMNAGADFLVSPFFEGTVCKAALLKKKLWIPGCITPTEINIAAQAGCTLIKIFPGSAVGFSFVSNVKPLFPSLQFIVTGGVDTSEKSIAEWFNAGVDAIGIGSKLITSEIVENNRFAELTNCTKNIISLVQFYKKNYSR